jgi:hypothetical protein
VVYVRDADARQDLMQSARWKEVAHGSTQELHWSLILPEDRHKTHYLAFRGTSDLRHWAFNVQTLLSRWPEGGKVHGGFARAYQKVAPSLYKALATGGALALLASTELNPDATYTFGCPRPGNPAFAQRAEALPVFRVIHDQDLVTTLPYTTELLKDLAYQHVGQPVHLRPEMAPTFGPSPHLPETKASWKQALHALVEGDYLGEPIPALQDHAPARYVDALLKAPAPPEKEEALKGPSRPGTPARRPSSEG